MTEEILAVALAYLLGAIPTGYLVVKAVKGVDIRDYGSGNTGATNVKRVAGGKAAFGVLLLDLLKGLVPVLIIRYLFPDAHVLHVLVGLAAVLGHSKSVFLRFSGGKSAATGLGSILGLAPEVALLGGLTAFLVFKLSRIVSLGSLSACVVTPVLMFLFDEPLPYTLYTLLASGYVAFLHKANIERLIRGTENRI